MDPNTSPTTPTPPNLPEGFGEISAEEERRRRLVAEQIARAYGKKLPKFESKPVYRPAQQDGAARPALPTIPLWMTLASVVLFVVLEAQVFGWARAAGIALVIFVHECGHLAAVRKLKLPVVGIVLIPFLGGIAFSGRRGQSATDDAYIGILGPIYGLATGLVCLALYPVTKEPFFLSLAGLIFWMHLFNMIPIPPLDGSHVLPMLQKPKPGVYDPYISRVTPAQKFQYVALYVGVALFSGIGGYIISQYTP
ncbi:MAG: hypothetical protein H7145_12535 [Akkermansiaceae bacterium]|nr:hypothetical protein [Armatimonadota bacterium]